MTPFPNLTCPRCHGPMRLASLGCRLECVNNNTCKEIDAMPTPSDEEWDKITNRLRRALANALADAAKKHIVKPGYDKHPEAAMALLTALVESTASLKDFFFKNFSDEMFEEVCVAYLRACVRGADAGLVDSKGFALEPEAFAADMIRRGRADGSLPPQE